MIDFSALVKRTEAYNVISRDKAQGRLSHAYLVLCSDGANLGEYLKEIAKLLLCPFDACQNCAVCSRIENGVFPDVVFLPKEGDSVTSEEVNELIAESFVKPYESDKKVFVISQAQSMNLSSQNKLLKTLEEPPKNVHIILGATSEFAILPTVRSRVKKLSIAPFTREMLQATLSNECPDGERLLDAISCSDGTVGKTLALYNDENLEKVMQLAQEILVDMQSSKDLLEYSERITQSKTDLTQLIEVLSLFVRDMLVSFENKPSLAFNKKVTERLLQAKGYTKGALVNILEDLVMATKRVQANGNKTMVQEWLLFKILEDKFKWQKL